MSSKLPINLEDLLRQRKDEGERVEYKKGWNPDPITRTLCAFANDFENLGGDFLKELDLTEGRSTGISKVLKVMKENGSPPPRVRDRWRPQLFSDPPAGAFEGRIEGERPRGHKRENVGENTHRNP